jgi:phage terminase large subunit GpA-like protein
VRTASNAYDDWMSEVTPPLVEAMNMLTSRDHEAVVFAGPARSGKTQALVGCFSAYMIKCSPADMMIVQMSQEKARDYSKLNINRMIRNSPELLEELSTSRQDDNTYDKWFKSGAALRLAWPTINQLSGNDFRFVALTDYDRMPQDIDKEGSPFKLAKKRTQTFLSRGMTVAESSPGFEVTDPNWKPGTPHEAPPTKGILGLFNLGDRRRLYWRCPHCLEYYMQLPGIEGFVFNHNRDLFGVTDTEIAGDVQVICTSCGSSIDESHKLSMTANSVWVPEGCKIEREGGEYGVVGDARQSKIASFWQPGASAAYQTWRSIVQEYLNGMRLYDISGDEDTLRATTNVDQGSPYLRQNLAESVDSNDYKSRAEPYERYTVPIGVRCIVATVDVQGGKAACYVVQVHGVGIRNEKWVIDRYTITKSSRKDDGGNELPISPAAHIEDWAELTKKLVNATYKLPDGREMRVAHTLVDSGGEAGVTERAYEWWRQLRKYSISDRVTLIKGDGQVSQKTKLGYPDSSGRKDRHSGAIGDVPVLFINGDKIKDAISNDLARLVSGPGYIHFPCWLDQWFYDELTAEQRGDDGKWTKVSNRNESLDLFVYFYAYLFHQRVERENWENPRPWLKCWDENPNVMTAEQRRALQTPTQPIARQRGRRQRFKFN